MGPPASSGTWRLRVPCPWVPPSPSTVPNVPQALHMVRARVFDPWAAGLEGPASEVWVDGRAEESWRRASGESAACSIALLGFRTCLGPVRLPVCSLPWTTDAAGHTWPCGKVRQHAALVTWSPGASCRALSLPWGPPAYERHELFLKRRVAGRRGNSFALKPWLWSWDLPPGVCPGLQKGISICQRHSGPQMNPALEQLPRERAGVWRWLILHTIHPPPHHGPDRVVSKERVTWLQPRGWMQITWGSRLLTSVHELPSIPDCPVTLGPWVSPTFSPTEGTEWTPNFLRIYWRKQNDTSCSQN